MSNTGTKLTINIRDLGIPFEAGKSYRIDIDEGFTKEVGNNRTLSQARPSFQIISTITQASIISTVPANDSTGFINPANASMTFDRLVYKNAGNLYLYRSDNTLLRTIPVSDADIVLFESSSTVGINLLGDLNRMTDYYVTFDGSSFNDNFFINATTVTNSSTWEFQTGKGAEVNPIRTTTTNAVITLTFNRPLIKDVGNFYVKKSSDNTTLYTIPITSSSVSVLNNTSTINLTNRVLPQDTLYLAFDANTYKDTSIQFNIEPITDDSKVKFTYNVMTNTSITRSFLHNNETILFADNPPEIIEVTNTASNTYLLSLSCDFGEFGVNENGSDASPTWTYTGTRSQINTIIPTIRFWNEKDSLLTGTCVLSLARGGITQVSSSIPLSGITGTVSLRTFATSTNWIPEYKYRKYGIDTLLIGGGGGGSQAIDSAGGAGGVLEVFNIQVANTSYPITIGAAGQSHITTFVGGNIVTLQFATEGGQTSFLDYYVEGGKTFWKSQNDQNGEASGASGGPTSNPSGDWIDSPGLLTVGPGGGGSGGKGGRSASSADPDGSGPSGPVGNYGFGGTGTVSRITGEVYAVGGNALNRNPTTAKTLYGDGADSRNTTPSLLAKRGVAMVRIAQSGVTGYLGPVLNTSTITLSGDETSISMTYTTPYSITTGTGNLYLYKYTTNTNTLVSTIPVSSSNVSVNNKTATVNNIISSITSAGNFYVLADRGIIKDNWNVRSPAVTNTQTFKINTLELYGLTYFSTLTNTNTRTSTIGNPETDTNGTEFIYTDPPNTVVYDIANTSTKYSYVSTTSSNNISSVAINDTHFMNFDNLQTFNGSKIVNVRSLATGNLVTTLDISAITSTSSWLNSFGSSIAMSNSKAIVSTYVENSAPNPAFIYDASTWNLLHTIYPTLSNTEFGICCDISDNHAIVGGEQYALIYSAATGALLYTLYQNPTLNFEFGKSVAICENYAIVGAHKARDISTSTEYGRAFVYDVSTGNLRFTLENPRPARAPAGPSFVDYFGYSVAINNKYAIVGAWGESEQDLFSGCVYIFSSVSGELLGILENPGLLPGSGGDLNNSDFFGIQVTLSDNNLLVVTSGEENISFFYQLP